MSANDSDFGSIEEHVDDVVASHMTYEVVNSSGAKLLLGLQWFALIGSRPEVTAQKIAKALKSTHYVLLSDSSRVAGCIKYSSRQKGRLKNLAGQTKTKFVAYSVAALFATSHRQGAHACIFSQPDNGFWLVASNDGHVLCNTDRFFCNRSLIEQELEQIRNRYPALTLVVLEQGWERALPVWLRAQPSKDTILLALRYSRRQIFIVFGCCSLMLWIILVGYRSDLSRSARLSTDQGLAIDSAVGSIRENATDPMVEVDTGESLHTVVSTIGGLPVIRGGWKLHDIECFPTELIWQCRARYQRLHAQARNSSLTFPELDGVDLQYLPLNEALLVWSTKRLTRQVLANYPNGSNAWMTSLQELEPAFASITVSPTVLTSSFSSKSAPRFYQVRLTGPLRAVLLLDRLKHIPIRWASLVVIVEPNLNQPPATKGSALTLELQGDLYAN